MADSNLTLHARFLYPSPRTSLFANSSQPIPSNFYYGLLEFQRDLNIPSSSLYPPSKPTPLLKYPFRILRFTFSHSLPFQLNFQTLLLGSSLFEDTSVLIATSPSVGIPAALYASRKSPHLPIILFAIGLPPSMTTSPLSLPRSPLRSLLRILHHRPLHFVTLGGYSHQLALSQFLQIPLNRISFIPLGVDTNFYQPTTQPSDQPPYVLSVGADSARDYQLLSHLAQTTQLPIYVIAPSHMRPPSIPSNMHWIGLQTPTRTRTFIQRARFLVMTTTPNHYFSGQTVLFSAMAMRVPVLFTDWGQARDYNLKDQIHADIVHPPSHDTLHERMIRLWLDAAHRSFLTSNSYQLIKRHYSMPRFASRLFQLAQRLLTPNLDPSTP